MKNRRIVFVSPSSKSGKTSLCIALINYLVFTKDCTVHIFDCDPDYPLYEKCDLTKKIVAGQLKESIEEGKKLEESLLLLKDKCSIEEYQDKKDELNKYIEENKTKTDNLKKEEEKYNKIKPAIIDPLNEALIDNILKLTSTGEGFYVFDIPSNIELRKLARFIASSDLIIVPFYNTPNSIKRIENYCQLLQKLKQYLIQKNIKAVFHSLYVSNMVNKKDLDENGNNDVIRNLENTCGRIPVIGENSRLFNKISIGSLNEQTSLFLKSFHEEFEKRLQLNN